MAEALDGLPTISVDQRRLSMPAHVDVREGSDRG